VKGFVMKKSLYVLSFAVVYIFLFTSKELEQTSPPGSDIFLGPLTVDEGSLSEAHPVSVATRSGYDSQPGFSADGSFSIYASWTLPSRLISIVTISVRD
jgi:hypothetical protein